MVGTSNESVPGMAIEYSYANVYQRVTVLGGSPSCAASSGQRDDIDFGLAQSIEEAARDARVVLPRESRWRISLSSPPKMKIESDLTIQNEDKQVDLMGFNQEK